MAGRLNIEVAQQRPFPTIEVEAALNIVRTADALGRHMSEVLKPWGLTPTQYNVLRILRGAGERGHTCTAVSDRMLTRDPDVTRLIDRLEARGLVARTRDPDDRRAVVIRLTTEGRELVDQLDAPVDGMHKKQLSHLGAQRLQELIALLEAAREQVGG
ncbi:MAG TPA: MarR family transcriptional regulator [Gemmatimonadales bacterium]|nr:MarR family transcriptional regulator [Gemmatimonadales bacterium]